MRDVVPSQVAQVIDQFFPWARDDLPQASVQPQDASYLRGILDLIQAIPDSLLSCPVAIPEDRTALDALGAEAAAQCLAGMTNPPRRAGPAGRSRLSAARGFVFGTI